MSDLRPHKAVNTPYIGRFAPSPSGPLHFGSLVAAMGSYLDAKSHAGMWLLRIEDIDTPRVRPGATQQILHTLEQLGFVWDGEILYQSHRIEAYQESLEHLKTTRRIYACRCSRKQIAELGRQGAESVIYPGACRGKRPEGDPGEALRIDTRYSEIINIVDRIAGPQSQDIEQECGDFVIFRADGIFAYQLAVVVDDAFQGITHVVRGQDLLTSTPRQLFLQRLLKLPTPSYAHLPLVLGEDGRKLSKSSAAHPVDLDNPVRTLWSAYAFLRQRMPISIEIPSTKEAFWKYAIANWSAERTRIG